MQSHISPSSTETTRGGALTALASGRIARGGYTSTSRAQPYDRGYQHGWLLADEIRAAINRLSS